MKNEDILITILKIASTASDSISDSQIKDDIVEPLLRVAKDMKTKGFVKEALIQPLPQGAPATPADLEGLGSGVQQVAQDKIQQDVEKSLNAPQGESSVPVQSLNMVVPPGTDLQSAQQILDTLPDELNKIYQEHGISFKYISNDVKLNKNK